MNEKATPNETAALLPTRRRARAGFPAVAALTLVAAGSLLANFQWSWSHEAGHHVGEDGGATPWSWSDVKPSRDLAWVSCYDGSFECARLDVPMDWQSPSDDKRVVLGVMKLPAKSGDGSSVPPLLMNPGGPGGSGISFLRSLGPHIQAIAGDYHDVISWDPRGVGVSTPRADCWGDVQKRLIWAMQETHVPDERPGLIYDAYSRAAAYSGVCERTMNETGILNHLSTAYAARDMLQIVEKSGHEKLRYWGFSYGTILGGVFASMYPDKVERLVSDGNVDYTDYFERDRARFSKDADAILLTFDKACHDAGPDKCDLWAPSANAVTERRDGLLTSLKRSPVLLGAWSTDTGPEMPVLVTYSLVQRLTHALLYKPLANAPLIASVYAALEAGDAVPFYRASLALLDGGSQGSTKPDLLCPVGATPPTEPLETGMEMDAFPAIMCSDGERVDSTPEEVEEYLNKIVGLSKWTGGANMEFLLPCVGRSARPDWRFVPEAGTEIETEAPILFVNNVLDNVTPLESAHNNSAHFPGSVVLQQNSLGHCSAAAPSACTAKHVRAYFLDATLPPRGTECDQDYGLFETSALAQDELSSAVREVSRLASLRFGRLPPPL